MKRKFAFLLIFLFVLAAATAAMAAGKDASGSDAKVWIWQVINFLILVAVLVFAAKKPFSQYLRARTEAIQKSLEEAKLTRELAEKAMKEVEDRLRLKDDEIANILKAAKASGETERQALVDEAEKMGKRISEHATANIEIELKKAKDAIRKEAAELAVEITERRLKEKLTPEEQNKLIEESVAKLEAKN